MSNADMAYTWAGFQSTGFWNATGFARFAVLPLPLPLPLLVLVLVLVLVLMSIGTYYLIERPFLSLRKPYLT